jgi:drug/metabolite transporter (DMT)-like permease
VLARIPIGIRFMLLSAFAFSVMGAFVKLAGTRLPTSELITARALVTLIVSALLLRRRRLSPWGHRRGLLFVRGCFGFCGLCCVYYALTHLPLAEATVLQYLHPVFTAMLAARLIAEVPTRRVLFSIALSLTGALLVARPSLLFGQATAPLDALGVAAAIAGAVFSALAYVTVRKLNQTEDPDVITFYFPLVALPASLPALATDAVLPTGVEWLWLLLLGLATQVGQIALTYGMKTETASRATSFSYMQIVFATLLGAAVFGELPHPLTLVGMALIVAAMLLNLRGGGSDRALP